MSKFGNLINTANVKEGEVSVFFLGQAGFAFKTHGGVKVAVDPYLSDCCERYFGFKRLMPYILSPTEVEFDLLLASHAHYDHFDVDSMPLLMQNGKTELVAASDAYEECTRLNLKSNVTYLKKGDVFSRFGVKIEAVDCDHGELAPHALGFLIEIDGKKIYYMGDTAYREDILQNPKLHNADLLILPINGMFGNLNEAEAARVCEILTPKLAVPCHYWNFAEHGGNPFLFMENMKEKTKNIPYCLMRPSEKISI